MAERRSVKLTDEEVSGFSLRKEGRYTVEIVKVEEKKSKGGNDMYEIEYNVIDAPEGAQKGKIRDWVLLEEYLSSLVQLAKATGFPVGNDFEIPLPEELEGKELVVDIEHQDATTKDAQGNKIPVMDEDTGKQRKNASIKRRLSLEAAAKSAASGGAGRAKSRVRKL